MADDNLQYEFKTVRTIRGAETRTSAKWQKEGWEFVSQERGAVRTEMTFRRPTRKVSRRLTALAGGAVVVLLATVITVGALQEGGDDAVANPPASPVETEASPGGQTPVPSATDASPDTSAPAITETAVPVEETALTVENSPELAALLALPDYCDSSIADFAAKYQGRTIEFDGNISAMNLHENYDTRYDLLIGAGDFSETSAIGPAFQFRDVNLTFDLHLTGDDRPETIGARDNLRITAQVNKYEDAKCLFLLEPIRTEAR